MKEPRCFALMVQWAPFARVSQDTGLTWAEAWDGLQQFRRSPNPPFRVAMALVVPK